MWIFLGNSHSPGHCENAEIFAPRYLVSSCSGLLSHSHSSRKGILYWITYIFWDKRTSGKFRVVWLETSCLYFLHLLYLDLWGQYNTLSLLYHCKYSNREAFSYIVAGLSGFTFSLGYLIFEFINVFAILPFRQAAFTTQGILSISRCLNFVLNHHFELGNN